MKRLPIHIDLFQNQTSTYGVLAYFTVGLQKALERRQIHSRILNIACLSEGELLAELSKDRPICTIGFNILIGEHTFLEPLKIPHLSIIVDSVGYYPELFSLPHSIVAFVEEDSCEFLLSFGHEATFCFPHAVEKEFADDTHREKITTSIRDLEVVACMSFIDHEEIRTRWKEIFPNDLVNDLEEIVEEVLSSDTLSHMQAFLQAMQEKPYLLHTFKTKHVEPHDVMNSIERVLRGLDKVQVLKAIQDHEVHLYCSQESQTKWRQCLDGKKNIIYHDEVPFEHLFSLFTHAKIVLNSIPTIKRGFHERLLMGTCAGATILSSSNFQIKTTFLEDKAFVLYNGKSYNKIDSQLKNVLDNEPKRLQNVLQARKLILRDHTWDTRVEMLQKVLPSLLRFVQAT